MGHSATGDLATPARGRSSPAGGVPDPADARPNRPNPTGKINGWKSILNTSPITSGSGAGTIWSRVSRPARCFPVDYRFVAGRHAPTRRATRHGSLNTRVIEMSASCLGARAFHDASRLVHAGQTAQMVAVRFDDEVNRAAVSRALPARLPRAGRTRRAPDDVRAAVQQEPKLHRFVNVIPAWLVQAARIVLDQYHGDAAALWIDRPRPRWAADLNLSRTRIRYFVPVTAPVISTPGLPCSAWAPGRCQTPLMPSFEPGPKPYATA
jgi:hypothetical protein